MLCAIKFKFGDLAQFYCNFLSCHVLSKASYGTYLITDNITHLPSSAAYLEDLPRGAEAEAVPSAPAYLPDLLEYPIT